LISKTANLRITYIPYKFEFKTSMLALKELNQKSGTYALTNIEPTIVTFPTFFFNFYQNQTPPRHPSNNNNKLQTRLRTKKLYF